MQTLYTLESMGNATPEGYQQGVSILNDKLKRGMDLLVISLSYFQHIAEYVVLHAAQKASKYLPTQEDLNVNTKLAGNTFLKQLTANASYNNYVQEPTVAHAVNNEWVKKLFLQLIDTDAYQSYIESEDRTIAKEKEIFRFVWEKIMLENESFMEYFSEELTGWEDDKEMTIMLMENLFKSNAKVNFNRLISEEKEAYSHELLRTVLEKNEFCKSLIHPKLSNWDTERVALIDLLLLKMGVCELLFFPTIPTKVTINEYIEIAKRYSTPQSGQFVNGVLDNILKDLVKENKINKQERSRKS